MKANLQYLGLKDSTEYLKCYWVKAPLFGFHWHYHTEFEITYVHRGQGIRMVGDNVSYFQEGDFVLMGSNVPHTWISDDDFNEQPHQMEVVVLQFLPRLFPDEWVGLSSMSVLKLLLNKAKRGVYFSDSYRKEAAQRIISIANMQGFEQFVATLQLLNFLGEDEQTKLLISPAYTPTLNNKTEQRLLHVCQYIHEHFTEAIKLQELARLANMNTTSFCRFFRQSTGQTASEYIGDLRIGKASNLLLNDPNMAITEIAFRSGFNNQALFNRQFLKRKKMTPSTFRKIR